MTRREIMLDVVSGRSGDGYVPAAFFLHFDPKFHKGQAAVNRHLEYFRETGMDFVKIQYEHPFPAQPQIKRAADWKTVRPLDAAYFNDPLDVVSGVVKAVNHQAMVVVTLYSAVMHAAHAVGRDQLTAHLDEDPSATAKGLRAINDSILVFIRECVNRGLDGFYASSQGGEAGRFRDQKLFAQVIKPLDLEVMNEINRLCPFNILHVCDYHGLYDDLSPYLDYPGHIVNCGTRLTGGARTPRELAQLFGRPFMGGMDRHGVIVNGTPEQISLEARSVLQSAPQAFVLGADCTVPSDIPVDHLKAAIDTAHSAGKRN